MTKMSFRAKVRICYPRRMAKGSSLNGKQLIKDNTLENQEGITHIVQCKRNIWSLFLIWFMTGSSKNL
jgi:hypothetical protein